MHRKHTHKSKVTSLVFLFFISESQGALQHGKKKSLFSLQDDPKHCFSGILFSELICAEGRKIEPKTFLAICFFFLQFFGVFGFFVCFYLFCLFVFLFICCLFVVLSHITKIISWYLLFTYPLTNTTAIPTTWDIILSFISYYFIADCHNSTNVFFLHDSIHLFDFLWK